MSLPSSFKMVIVVDDLEVSRMMPPSEVDKISRNVSGFSRLLSGMIDVEKH